MSPDDRYDVSGLTEAQFESGSDGLVLKNLRVIKSSAEMDSAEANALVEAMDSLVRTYDEQHRFMAKDICEMHRLWLGGIYAWAGEYRQVNVSKGDFMFAAAARVPALMVEFERDVLTRYTPCNFAERDEVVRAIAGENKENYFAAVRAGLDRNYRPMEKIFLEIIERSLSEF